MENSQRSDDSGKSQSETQLPTPPSSTPTVIGSGDQTVKSNTRQQPASNQSSDADNISAQLQRAEIWMICLTALIVIVGGLQWHVMSGQLEQMKSGSAQTDRLIDKADSIAKSMTTAIQQNQVAIDKAADANRRAIDASDSENRRIVESSTAQSKKALDASIEHSKSALDFSIEASRLDQRAWIGVTKIDSIIEHDKSTEISVHIRNTGKTPAIDVHGMVVFEWKPAGTIPELKYREEDAGGRSILVPGYESTITIPNPRLFSLDETNRMKSGALKDYTAGTIWYKDIFDRHWETTFCFTFDHELKALTPCLFHNSAR